MFRLSYLARVLGVAAVVVIPALLALLLALKLLKLAGRYVFGFPMLGPERESTNATFWSDGTGRVGHQLEPWETATPSRWSLKAYWRRACWRLIVPTVAATVVYAWLRWPTVVEWSVVVGVATVVGVKEWRGLHWWRLRHHLATYVYPLHRAIAPKLGIDPEVVKPRDWLHIPRNFADAEADPCIRIELPETFYAGDDEDEEGGGGMRRAEPSLRRLVDGQVFAKLELRSSEMSTTYHVAGPRPMVEYHHLPAVPDLVKPTLVAAELEKAKPRNGDVVFGVGKGGRVKKVNLDSESPHTLIVVGTGGGKTSTVRSVVVPMLPKGEETRVVFLDVKRASHKIFKSHPHARIVRDDADIHDELRFLLKELDRRNACIDDDVDPGPRIVVVIEEAGSLAERLSQYWQDNRPKGHTGSNPALSAMRQLGNMGRQARVNLVSVDQAGDMSATGGRGSRVNFGNVLIGRDAPKNVWQKIASDLKRPPKRPGKRGRFYSVSGSYPDELQAVFWDDADAVEHAFQGFAEEERVSGSQCDRESFYLGKHHVTVTAEPETATTVGTHENVNTGMQEKANIGSNETVIPPSRESAPPRLVVVDGNGAAETQSVPEVDEAAAAEFAEEIVSEEPQGEPVVDDEPVTLREAFNRGVVYANRLELKDPLTSLRGVANRKRGQPRYDPTFPSPVGKRGQAKLYRPSQLRFWERNSTSGAGQSKGGA